MAAAKATGTAGPGWKTQPCLQGIVSSGLVDAMASRFRAGLAAMSASGGGSLWVAATGAAHATIDGRPFGLPGVVDLEIYEGAESGAAVSAYAYGPGSLGEHASWTLVKGGVSAGFLSVPLSWDRRSTAMAIGAMSSAVLAASRG